MDFSDRYINNTTVAFANLPKSHEHLNGQKVEIIDREFRGWSKWFYKINGHKEWFHEGCFKSIFESPELLNN